MKTKELNRIKVNVNGLEMEVFSNLTILQALIQEDIYIPHLCYDMRLIGLTATAGYVWWN